ncbi:MAG: acetyl/propionyl/methylcrotonyl-CoA carboxylase subunit alpha [Kiloniellales bacterium]
MFASLLIANRGEIACRVIRTARRLGLRTVAVYSAADAGARHVALADEARLIGPPPSGESYLRGETIIAAARESGAEAIHPGYGFLAENADFAEAVAAAGLVFVGPPAAAIRAMGSKSEAKAIMARANVPLVPGYHGAEQDEALLAEQARRIGYPVLIKASAGGGGKGMRVVERAADFAEALASARREARGAFGDDRMLIERYLTRPRHIELQVFADDHGNVLHLFERDCSLQRRHQKVIEEAPAPGLDPARRGEMGAAAVAAARAIGYRGAGTVEFIVEDGDFYFMEMNTRLQVEHPVTEMITGQDLVEWQLRVAAGEPLPCGQDDLAIKGHAFEARLYAEDPARDFLPATGALAHLRFPEETPHLRVETGVRAGDSVSPYYDPMIAKLVVWDRDRAAALARLRAALAATQVVGVTTNLEFLAALAGHPEFAAGAVDTGFIVRHREDLLPEAAPASDEVLALAALAEILHRKAEAERQAAGSGDPYSPWHLVTGWRLNSGTHSLLRFRDGERDCAVALHFEPGGYRLELPGGTLLARGEIDQVGDLQAELGGRRVGATVIRRGRELSVLAAGCCHQLRLHDALESAAGEETGVGRLTAPMPGKVVQVLTAPGRNVARGERLMILEAMKMEHAISAPADGTVAAVHYDVGDLVEEGSELITFDGSAGEATAGGAEAAQ